MSATMPDFAPGEQAEFARALRAAIADGATVQPAEFNTPTGLFICRACLASVPNDTCVGWVKAEGMHGLVCKECCP